MFIRRFIYSGVFFIPFYILSIQSFIELKPGYFFINDRPQYKMFEYGPTFQLEDKTIFHKKYITSLNFQCFLKTDTVTNSKEDVDIFLKEYINKHNTLFGKQVLYKEDVHIPLKENEDLIEVFARKVQRKLSKNLTFEYKGNLIYPQLSTLRMNQNGITFLNKKEDIDLLYKGYKLPFKTHYQMESQAQEMHREDFESWLNKKEKKTSKNHPKKY